MATIAKKGKRKKTKVYIVRRKKAVSPLLIAGLAAGAYILYNYLGHPGEQQPGDVTPLPNDGGLNHSNNPDIIDDGSGTGTSVIQPTPVVVAPSANLPAVSTVAAGNRSVLLRDAAAYPAIVAALKTMSSQEIIDTYQYFYGYFIYGKELYRYPDAAHPSQWNTQLYDAIQVIRAKYKIF